MDLNRHTKRARHLNQDQSLISSFSETDLISLVKNEQEDVGDGFVRIGDEEVDDAYVIKNLLDDIVGEISRERAGGENNYDQHTQRVPLFLREYGELPEKLALSFSGCGFLGAYHFGVMFCFRRHAKSLLDRVEKVAGTSAGSLVACLICYAPDTLEDALNEMFRLADDLNAMKLGALSPGFYMNQHLHKLIDQFLPKDMVDPKYDLYVSVTRQRDRTNHMVGEFTDREFLINSLLASCYIPMYSNGYYAEPPKLNNEAYIDGGYTNNLHVFSDCPTISISPFSGSAIIAPADRNMFEWRMSLGNQQMKVNMQNIVRGAQALFPPNSNVLHAYYELGFRDGLKFLLQNGLLERSEGTEV